MCDFLMHLQQNVRVLAHFQFPDNAIYISMSVGNGFCRECIRSASPHMLRLRGVLRRHIFRLISHRHATCIYSYVSLTTNNTFHPDRLYALMNDSRDAIETQVYRKCFSELYDNDVPTNR